MTWRERLRARAKAVRLSSTQGQVLWLLASYGHHETGKAWPSIAELVAITHLADSTVRRALERLDAVGLIVDTGERTGSTGRVKVWQLGPATAVIRSLEEADSRGA